MTVPCNIDDSTEYRSDDITTNFLYFSILDIMYRWSMMKNIHSPNVVGIGAWGPEIWPHEYLISPIEISANWPGSKQFKLISMGLIRYSWGHILGHHDPIHVKFGVCGVFIMFFWNMVMKRLRCKMQIWWPHTSVLSHLYNHQENGCYIKYKLEIDYTIRPCQGVKMVLHP